MCVCVVGDEWRQEEKGGDGTEARRGGRGLGGQEGTKGGREGQWKHERRIDCGVINEMGEERVSWCKSRREVEIGR